MIKEKVKRAIALAIMIFNDVRDLTDAMAKNSKIASSLTGSSQELNPWRSVNISSEAETESTIVIDPPGSDSRVKSIASVSQSEGGDMYSKWKRKAEVVQNSSVGDPHRKVFKIENATDLDTQPPDAQLTAELLILDQYSGREFDFIGRDARKDIYIYMASLILMLWT